MKEAQDLFHKINNKLNNITVEAGAASYESAENLNAEDLKQEHKRLLDKLASIEKSALQAGELSHQLKDIVYKALGIDKEKT